MTINVLFSKMRCCKHSSTPSGYENRCKRWVQNYQTTKLLVLQSVSNQSYITIIHKYTSIWFQHRSSPFDTLDHTSSMTNLDLLVSGVSVDKHLLHRTALVVVGSHPSSTDSVETTADSQSLGSVLDSHVVVCE